MKQIRFLSLSILCGLLSVALNPKAAAQADGVTVTIDLGAEMITPPDGSTLTTPTVTFQWTPLRYADQYWLQLGSTPGGRDLYSSSTGQRTSITLTSLPISGRPIYATLWSYAFGDWYFFSYAYPTAGVAQPARILSPANGSTLAGSSVTFTWAPVAQAVAYHLYVGNTLDGHDLVSQAIGRATSWTITNLPQDGRPIFVKLWTWTGSAWQSSDSRYTAASSGTSVTTGTGTGSNSNGNATGSAASKQVLRFDGVDDFALVPIKASADSYTVSIWFKTSYPDCGIFMATTTSLGDHDRNIFLHGGNLSARLWADETISTVNQNYADGNWHQVTHVYGGDMGAQKLFVDGQLRATGTLTKSIFTTQSHLRIGMSWGTANAFFRGDIFDVRLWNRALSADEIAAQVKQVPSLSYPNLVGYWTFAEAQTTQSILNSAPQQSSVTGTLGADAQVAQDDPQRVLYQAK